MRAVWKGAISFGLVSIPVKLYRATETKDVSFHQVRASDGSRIRYQRLAVADGAEVAYADIAKGFELPSGETVVLTDDDLADLPLTTNRTIEVDTFVPLDQVDPIYFDKTYYVEPDGKQALKPYALLRDALADSGRVAVVKVALRQREQVATLRVRDGLFVLETMVWPDEVRKADFAFLDEKVEVRDQELAMAKSLIDSLAGDFDPHAYSDAYREALEEVVAAKVEGRDFVAAVDPSGGDGGDVVDLMSALRASVDAAKKSRAERAEAEPSAADATPAHPKAAKKAPAKKAAKGTATDAEDAGNASNRGGRARKSA
jgi:DNA end-binding protein Ku